MPPFLHGLQALTVSTVALASTLAGVGLYASSSATTASAVPVAAEALDSSTRADELSRSGSRATDDPEADARAEALSTTVQQINQHVADLKAQAEAERAAAEAKAAEEAAAAAHFRATQGYDPATTSPKEIARQIAANKYGWGAAQFTCYDNIIMRESRWITTADNPTSSAYGIPQALPGSRMASFGADWRTNPATQIKWGLDYVDDRYGTPCAAWSFKRANGWY